MLIDFKLLIPNTTIVEANPVFRIIGTMITVL